MPGDERALWEGLLPTQPVRFAPDFVWGLASSAFQAEGGDVPNDWVDAARAGRVPPNPGNGFWSRAEEDLALAASLGARHYRLSLEWSRVEPAEGRFDEAALDRYRAICDAAQAAGVVPWVNFFHFTHPRWFAARGGFLAPGGQAAFLRYLERAARALRGRARHFHVSNESMVYVLASYLTGANPPFVREREAAWDMTRTVLELQAEGYRILKGQDPGATVASIEVYLDVRPRDPADAGHRAAAERLDAWYHGVLLEALATGWIRLPGREPVELPPLRGALDLYGFNYYTPTWLGGEGGFGAGGGGPRDVPRPRRRSERPREGLAASRRGAPRRARSSSPRTAARPATRPSASATSRRTSPPSSARAALARPSAATSTGPPSTTTSGTRASATRASASSPSIPRPRSAA